MKLIFIDGPLEGKHFCAPTPPEKLEFPFYPTGNPNEHQCHTYIRIRKSPGYTFVNTTPLTKLPEVQMIPKLTINRKQMLLDRIARNKRRANQLRIDLGLPTLEQEETQKSLSHIDSALEMLKRQMEELQ